MRRGLFAAPAATALGFFPAQPRQTVRPTSSARSFHILDPAELARRLPRASGLLLGSPIKER